MQNCRASSTRGSISPSAGSRSIGATTRSTPHSIIKALEGIGYQAHPFAPERAEADESAQATWLLKCLAVAGFAAMNVMLLSVSVWSGNVSDMTQETRDLFHWLSALIALPAAAYAGQPFFQSAMARAARRQRQHGRADFDRRDAGARAVGLRDGRHAAHAYFDSAIMLLFFLLMRPLPRSGDAAEDAACSPAISRRLKAEFAHRLDASGEVMQVPAAALLPGDRMLVPSGRTRCPPTAPSSTASPRSTRAW